MPKNHVKFNNKTNKNTDGVSGDTLKLLELLSIRFFVGANALSVMSILYSVGCLTKHKNNSIKTSAS